MDTIGSLVKSGKLERVPVNLPHAERLIATAQTHLGTARLLAGTDDAAMAFTAAYDGVRKALVAVLACEGLRVRAMGGAHRITGRAVQLLMPQHAETLAAFDWMRQVRNSTEYPDDKRPVATRQDVAEAISDGEAIVSVCAEYVAERRE
ncbi:HEPN domain-containing protein [Gulosibacter massiliensis]|uniref:HEPN domain-containing protein n=1 Tax=Gulosibacter massiliensis TaxID=2479839 RepID=UPI000F636785|nr:HEPN domain-containing protein [Gulosibacter massiliensis]